MQISDVPNWKACRDGVMHLGKQLALDPGPEAARARCGCKADARVAPGWFGSPGKETHALQSGFYANLKNEVDMFPNIANNDLQQVQVWESNRWPQLEANGSSFQNTVKDAGKIMYDVSLLTLDLARRAALQRMQEKYSVDVANIEVAVPDLRQMAEEANFLPSRLVYYDAKFERSDGRIEDGDGRRKYSLPWHIDFNLATAFAPALWIDEEMALRGEDGDDSSLSGKQNPEHGSGLILRNPDGCIIPAAIGHDCLLIQLGAHSQLSTGGILKAGPHAVGKQKDKYGNYSLGRLSFGLFVYGKWDARMAPSPELLDIIGGDDNILKDDFSSLMKKAYTGETILDGYRKFEAYRNGS